MFNITFYFVLSANTSSIESLCVVDPELPIFESIEKVLSLHFPYYPSQKGIVFQYTQSQIIPSVNQSPKLKINKRKKKPHLNKILDLVFINQYFHVSLLISELKMKEMRRSLTYKTFDSLILEGRCLQEIQSHYLDILTPIKR